MHLHTHTTCHLDIKDDNVLVSSSGRLSVCDFGTAVRFNSRDMRMPWVRVRSWACSRCGLVALTVWLAGRLAGLQGMSPGGNQQHLAPEVLTAFLRSEAQPQLAGDLDYSHQAVRGRFAWAQRTPAAAHERRCAGHYTSNLQWACYSTRWSCRSRLGRTIRTIAAYLAAMLFVWTPRNCPASVTATQSVRQPCFIHTPRPLAHSLRAVRGGFCWLYVASRGAHHGVRAAIAGPRAPPYSEGMPEQATRTQ